MAKSPPKSPWNCAKRVKRLTSLAWGVGGYIRLLECREGLSDACLPVAGRETAVRGRVSRRHSAVASA
jgi:hypothetical protein